MNSECCTVFCSNLSPRVTEELLYELFLQAGPLKAVSQPKDEKGDRRQYAFIEYQHECSVDYAIELFQGTIMFGRELQLKRRNSNPSAGPSHPQHRRHSSFPGTGNIPFQQQVQMFRGAGFPYPPLNPLMMTSPINPLIGNSIFNPALAIYGAPRFPLPNAIPIPEYRRGDSPPLPPGEKQAHPSVGNYHKRHYDDRNRRSDYHEPRDKKSKYSDTLRDRSSHESRYQHTEDYQHRTSGSYHHDSYNESRSYIGSDHHQTRALFHENDHHHDRSSHRNDHHRERSSSGRSRTSGRY